MEQAAAAGRRPYLGRAAEREKGDDPQTHSLPCRKVSRHVQRHPADLVVVEGAGTARRSGDGLARVPCSVGRCACCPRPGWLPLRCRAGAPVLRDPKALDICRDSLQPWELTHIEAAVLRTASLHPLMAENRQTCYTCPGAGRTAVF